MACYLLLLLRRHGSHFICRHTHKFETTYGGRTYMFAMFANTPGEYQKVYSPEQRSICSNHFAHGGSENV